LPVAIDLSDPAIGALIRRKARKLARRSDDLAIGRDDLAHELVAALLARKSKFDASRGEAGAFLHVVLEHAATNILRELHAGKRTPSGQLVGAIGCVDQRQADSDEMRDLMMDVEEALGELPEYLREVAERLAASDTITEIARDLGVTRDTVYSRVAAIRKRFESRGLTQYLKNRFDTSPANRVVL